MLSPSFDPPVTDDNESAIMAEIPKALPINIQEKLKLLKGLKEKVANDEILVPENIPEAVPKEIRDKLLLLKDLRERVQSPGTQRTIERGTQGVMAAYYAAQLAREVAGMIDTITDENANKLASLGRLGVGATSAAFQVCGAMNFTNKALDRQNSPMVERATQLHSYGMIGESVRELPAAVDELVKAIKDCAGTRVVAAAKDLAELCGKCATHMRVAGEFMKDKIGKGSMGHLNQLREMAIEFVEQLKKKLRSKRAERMRRVCIRAKMKVKADWAPPKTLLRQLGFTEEIDNRSRLQDGKVGISAQNEKRVDPPKVVSTPDDLSKVLNSPEAEDRPAPGDPFEAADASEVEDHPNLGEPSRVKHPSKAENRPAPGTPPKVADSTKPDDLTRVSDPPKVANRSEVGNPPENAEPAKVEDLANIAGPSGLLESSAPRTLSEALDPSEAAGSLHLSDTSKAGEVGSPANAANLNKVLAPSAPAGLSKAADPPKAFHASGTDPSKQEEQRNEQAKVGNSSGSSGPGDSSKPADSCEEAQPPHPGDHRHAPKSDLVEPGDPPKMADPKEPEKLPKPGDPQKQMDSLQAQDPPGGSLTVADPLTTGSSDPMQGRDPRARLDHETARVAPASNENAGPAEEEDRGKQPNPAKSDTSAERGNLQKPGHEVLKGGFRLRSGAVQVKQAAGTGDGAKHRNDANHDDKGKERNEPRDVNKRVYEVKRRCPPEPAGKDAGPAGAEPGDAAEPGGGGKQGDKPKEGDKPSDGGKDGGAPSDGGKDGGKPADGGKPGGGGGGKDGGKDRDDKAGKDVKGGELSQEDIDELLSKAGVSDGKTGADPTKKTGRPDRFSETILGSADDDIRVRDATKNWPFVRYPSLQDFLTQSGLALGSPHVQLRIFTDRFFPMKPIAMLILDAREIRDLPQRMKIKTSSELRNIIVILDPESVYRVLMI